MLKFGHLKLIQSQRRWWQHHPPTLRNELITTHGAITRNTNIWETPVLKVRKLTLVSTNGSTHYMSAKHSRLTHVIAMITKQRSRCIHWSLLKIASSVALLLGWTFQNSDKRHSPKIITLENSRRHDARNLSSNVSEPGLGRSCRYVHSCIKLVPTSIFEHRKKEISRLRRSCL